MPRVKVTVNCKKVYSDLKDFDAILNHPDLKDKIILRATNMLGEEIDFIQMTSDGECSVTIPSLFADIDTSFYIEYQER